MLPQTGHRNIELELDMTSKAAPYWSMPLVNVLRLCETFLLMLLSLCTFSAALTSSKSSSAIVVAL